MAKVKKNKKTKKSVVSKSKVKKQTKKSNKQKKVKKLVKKTTKKNTTKKTTKKLTKKTNKSLSNKKIYTKKNIDNIKPQIPTTAASEKIIMILIRTLKK